MDTAIERKAKTQRTTCPEVPLNLIPTISNSSGSFSTTLNSSIRKVEKSSLGTLTPEIFIPIIFVFIIAN